jgi:cell division protein FtsQ
VTDLDQRTRKRFARRQWARRWLAWKPVLAIVLALVVLVVGVWLVYFSSYLSVKGVDVRGTSLLSNEQVRRAAAVPDGGALARVDLNRVRTRVEERTAVAVVELDGQLRGMDEDGVVFRDYAQAPPGLPRVQTGSDTSSDALHEAALVVGALPSDLAAKVDHVEVATVDEITLALRDGRTVRWGSSADSDLKAEVLARLLVAVHAQTYDVSVPGTPTTK